MARLLVVDDDPVTRQFFADVLARAGDVARCAEDVSTGLALAAIEPFDALLIDVNLPDGRGEEMLRRLRANPGAVSRKAIAIATSAELTSALRRQLRAAGFANVLRKPVTAGELDALLAATVPACAGRSSAITLAVIADNAPPPLLDDARALSATGDAAIVAALRALLAVELASLAAELQPAVENGDTVTACDRLHRLRAACGFCGANALDTAGDALRAALNQPTETRAVAWRKFAEAISATSAALAALD